MGISYAGVPLLLSPPSSGISQFVENYLRHNGRNLFSWNSAYRTSGQWLSKSANVSRVNMPAFNWRDPPPIGLNELYIPTGATRWAVGLFLATDTAIRQIIAALPKNGSSQFGTMWGGLQMDTPESTDTLNHKMWMLPPQPISGQYANADRFVTSANQPSETFGNETLWLLPLVDGRYFMQGSYQASQFTVSDWTTLLNTVLPNAIGGGSAVALNPKYPLTPDQDYFTPDPNEFARQYHNPAALMDAIAASLGRMPVYDAATGYFQYANWEDNGFVWNDQDVMAGGGWSRTPWPPCLRR